MAGVVSQRPPTRLPPNQSMNRNFNRQFVLIDFELLDDARFIEFMKTAEFATYMLLRRYIWRGGEKKPHFLGLEELYEQKRLLVCSVTNQAIADRLQLEDVTRVSKHLSKLEDSRVLRRIRTGRQNIYVLGEWVDYSSEQDGSRRLEWFYLEQRYGLTQSDLAQKAKSDLAPDAGQSWREKPNNNREENREENTVGNGVAIKGLPDLAQPREKTAYVAQAILDQLGDRHSEQFYRLVAAKVPEPVIRQALAEIRTDGAKDPPRVFTYRMKLYALSQRKARIGRT
jgi:hypothetical protein